MTSPFDKGDYDPTDIFAFEALAVTSAAGFTSGTFGPSGSPPAKAAHVSVEGGAVRWRADGNAPTASVGTLLKDGDDITVWGSADLGSIKFVATAGSVTLNIHYAR